MSDKIKVSTDHLDDIATYLKQLGNKLGNAASSLDDIWMDSTTAGHTLRSGSCRLSGNAGVSTINLSSTGATLRRYENALASYEDLCQSLAKRVQRVKERYIKLEGEISALANDNADEIGAKLNFPKDQSQWTDDMWSQYMAAAALPILDPTELKESFNFVDLLKDVVGSFGPMGTLFTAGSAIYDGIKTGDWTKGAKDVAKTLVAWSQFVTEHKWSGFSKANRFGSNYGTKNYVKQLFGFARTTGSKAAAWADKVRRNFSKGLEGTFRTFDPKVGYKPNWAGIVGTVIDLGANGYDNYKQVQAGEITADRAVVETIVHTGANLLIGTAAGAIAVATLPASVPAVAVAAGSAAIVWAVDGVTKLVTGGDKGLGEVVSEGAGWVYDQGKKVVSGAVEKGKEAVSDAIDKGKKAASKIAEKGADFLDGLRKKVVGTSRAIWT